MFGVSIAITAAVLYHHIKTRDSAVSSKPGNSSLGVHIQSDMEAAKAEAELLMVDCMRNDMIDHIRHQSDLFTEASLVTYVTLQEESVGHRRQCTAEEFISENPLYEATWMEARAAVKAQSSVASTFSRAARYVAEIARSVPRLG